MIKPLVRQNLNKPPLFWTKSLLFEGFMDKIFNKPPLWNPHILINHWRFICVGTVCINMIKNFFWFAPIYIITLDSVQKWPLQIWAIFIIKKKSSQLQTASTNRPKLWETSNCFFEIQKWLKEEVIAEHYQSFDVNGSKLKKYFITLLCTLQTQNEKQLQLISWRLIIVTTTCSS